MALFSQVFKNLRRSPYQVAAATLMMVVTFFMTTIFVLVMLASASTIAYFESRPQISAFFKDSATEKEINQIANELTTTGLTEEVKYISKEQALEIYREQNKDDPILLELVTADILPASLEIQAKNPADLAKISQTLNDKAQIEDLIFQKDVVERLTKITQTLRLGGLIFILLLIAESVLVILLIIGMRIASRREEINILQLIGASKWYVRRPFLAEGGFYGLAGAAIGTLFAFPVYFYLVPNLNNFFGIAILSTSILFFAAVFGAQVVAGFLVGTFGASLALFRYLR